jgi:hypothetical protein
VVTPASCNLANSEIASRRRGLHLPCCAVEDCILCGGAHRDLSLRVSELVGSAPSCGAAGPRVKEKARLLSTWPQRHGTIGARSAILWTGYEAPLSKLCHTILLGDCSAWTQGSRGRAVRVKPLLWQGRLARIGPSTHVCRSDGRPVALMEMGP